MLFFIQIFFFIDHFDCMIKMFCLKDQKKPPGSCLSAAAAAARLLLLWGLFFLRCGDLWTFFFLLV